MSCGFDAREFFEEDGLRIQNGALIVDYICQRCEMRQEARISAQDLYLAHFDEREKDVGGHIEVECQNIAVCGKGHHTIWFEGVVKVIRPTSSVPVEGTAFNAVEYMDVRKIFVPDEPARFDFNALLFPFTCPCCSEKQEVRVPVDDLIEGIEIECKNRASCDRFAFRISPIHIQGSYKDDGDVPLNI